MIEVRDLRKQFGQVTAVADVSFTCHDGEITGLLGANGAGKTTTMRMIYGLIRPDAGTALVDGVVMADDPLGGRRQLGVLPDSRGLYPRLTGRENIDYFARLHGLGGPELADRIDGLIDSLGMAGFVDRRTEGYSQGERMKTAIARATVHDPRNVVLDEPTNGLDVMSTRSMRELIRQMKDAGRCVLFSSHLMQEVAALCDRIIVIGAGRVVASGTPEELLDQTGASSLEDAFVVATGADGGLV